MIFTVSILLTSKNLIHRWFNPWTFILHIAPSLWA